MSGESRVVFHYGVHRGEGDVAHILQDRNSSGNMLGLKIDPPFKVQSKAGRPPHAINITSGDLPDQETWDRFTKMYEDELVQLMCPIPKDRGELAVYLNEYDVGFTMNLVALSRLSSPTGVVVKPFSSVTARWVREELSTTNIAPVVLTGLRLEDQERMYDIASGSVLLPRRVIFVGHRLMVIRSPLRRVMTLVTQMDSIELASMPMEMLGAYVLRRWSRGEQINLPLKRN